MNPYLKAQPCLTLSATTAYTSLQTFLVRSSMTGVMAGAVDVDKQAQYPIVLSDALLGRGTKELFTSIRCKLNLSTLDSNPLTKPIDR